MGHYGGLRNRYLMPGSDTMGLASRQRFAQQSGNHGHVQQVNGNNDELDLTCCS
jgi:hypothetical protein